VPKALRSLGSRWAASPGSKQTKLFFILQFIFIFSKFYFFQPAVIWPNRRFNQEVNRDSLI
jgi:hypothetical protein